MNLSAPSQPMLLAIDDDPTTRLLLEVALRQQGYGVCVAADGASGVQAFVAQRPALVLLDVQMPGLDGFQVCAQLRALDTDDTPVVMLTGSEDLASIEQAFLAGATDFITKPINLPLLVQRVRYALRGRDLNREVRETRQRQAQAQRMAGLGFWDWAPTNNRLTWSPDAADHLGLDAPLPDTPQALLERIHPTDRLRVQQAFAAWSRSADRLDLEFRVPAANGGEERIISLTGEGATSAAAGVQRVFGAFQNVTDSRRTQALVDHLALHDDLTGLANRRLFVRQVRDALARPAAAPVLVAWLDLTRFHRINEALGEAAGDALLVQVAQRLRLSATGCVALARMGGDAFALALQGPDAQALELRLQRVRVALETPFPVQGQEVFLTTCAGSALSSDGHPEAEQLLSLAKDAQQHARAQGLPHGRSGDGGRPATSLDLEQDLRRALALQQFELHYQPQMALRGSRPVGVEALLRWRHPVRGLVPPLQFIGLLEELGLIHEVGHWVLAEASRQARQWMDAGLALRVSVNLSPLQFMRPDLYTQIVETVARAGLPAHWVELEITESLAMQDPDRAVELLGHLRADGFRIAIDDFGIGHSSLAYLLRFPLDTIKIDRAFVMRVTETEADRAIIRAVTAIAQSMQLSTIAEGVETQRQCDFMEALGASEIQGYLISKPLPAADVAPWMAQFKRPHTR